MSLMRILAIETSCDDTSVALVEASGHRRVQAKTGLIGKPRFKVIYNIVSSQIKIHRPFGGVVPNLAKREHAKNLPKIFGRIMNKELRIKNTKTKIHNSKFIIPAIDAIAVTVGPGLEPALWAGIEFAKDLAKKLKKPLIGANHMEGHLYSNWLSARSKKYEARSKKIEFPAAALVVSGGHTILLNMTSLTKWKKLGETRDDAAGEAFDKVARLLGLPYPGGPEIEKIAKKGDPKAIKFPRPMLRDKNYDFSFSGLKTSVLYYLRDSKNSHSSNRFRFNVAASFQQAVVDVLIGKTIRAAREFGAKSVLLCGGVSVNKFLQKTLRQKSEEAGAKFFCPSFEYNTDNAAMIAAAAYIRHQQKKKLRLSAQSNLNL